MGRVIRLSISGRDGGTDAPSVDDLLGQLEDYFDILRSVEEAVAGDSGHEIEWRVVDASKNSPISLAVEAFPRQYGADVDRRAEATVRHAAAGMRALEA